MRSPQSVVTIYGPLRPGVVLVAAALVAFSSDPAWRKTAARWPPLATFGGPETAPNGAHEAALGAVLSRVLFDCTHKPYSGWFARWRYGVIDRVDVGSDLEAVQHNDALTTAVKVAVRVRAHRRLRLEAGVGVADDADGKSLHADLAVTSGAGRGRTVQPFWAVRFAAARGYPGDVCCFGGGGPGSTVGGTNVPPRNRMLIGVCVATSPTDVRRGRSSSFEPGSSCRASETVQQRGLNPRRPDRESSARRRSRYIGMLPLTDKRANLDRRRVRGADAFMTV